MPDESALLEGPSIESVRRRLKFASLYFDYVLLEAGIYDVSAGPGGWFGATRPPMDGEDPRWQTPRRRGAEQRQDFTISVGRDKGPGVIPGPMMPAISSAASISWKATLLPFARELPEGADWIFFVDHKTPSAKSGVSPTDESRPTSAMPRSSARFRNGSSVTP